MRSDFMIIIVSHKQNGPLVFLPSATLQAENMDASSDSTIFNCYFAEHPAQLNMVILEIKYKLKIILWCDFKLHPLYNII